MQLCNAMQQDGDGDGDGWRPPYRPLAALRVNQERTEEASWSALACESRPPHRFRTASCSAVHLPNSKPMHSDIAAAAADSSDSTPPPDDEVEAMALWVWLWPLDDGSMGAVDRCMLVPTLEHKSEDFQFYIGPPREQNVVLKAQHTMATRIIWACKAGNIPSTAPSPRPTSVVPIC